MRFLVKVIITSLIVAGVSEMGKRSSVLAALLASLPLTSLLAILWLYQDTSDPKKVIALSQGIFWAVLPSLLFFVVLPVFLRSGVRFGLAITSSSGIMIVAYLGYT